MPPLLSPYPSPSTSCHCDESLVKLSSLSAQPSLSASGHPRVPFCQESPGVFTQSSAKFPVGSSPKPSPSVSFHCVLSAGKRSYSTVRPSPSASKQPCKIQVELPAKFGQSSSLSANPSPSVSIERLGSFGQGSPRSETPSPSLSTVSRAVMAGASVSMR